MPSLNACHSDGHGLTFHAQHLLQLYFSVVGGSDLVSNGARVCVYLVVIAALVCLVPKEVNCLQYKREHVKFYTAKINVSS